MVVYRTTPCPGDRPSGPKRADHGIRDPRETGQQGSHTLSKSAEAWAPSICLAKSKTQGTPILVRRRQDSSTSRSSSSGTSADLIKHIPGVPTPFPRSVRGRPQMNGGRNGKASDSTGLVVPHIPNRTGRIGLGPRRDPEPLPVLGRLSR